MNMPNRLVMVRHGESEINVVTNLEKDGLIHPQRDQIYARPDFEQRLSYPKGVEQAQMAGEWLRDNGLPPESFDQWYVSMYYRCLETARHIGGEAIGWLPDIRIVERDWGEYGAVPKEQRLEMFPHIEKMRKVASLFVRYAGGQSMVDKSLDVKDWLGTLSREQADKKVIAVMHGETMWAARFLLERMMPHEYHELDTSKNERIENCTILDYNPVNPEDPTDIRPSLSDGWRRIINPVEPEKSPYGGEWQKLPGKRRFSTAQIDDILESTPRLIVPSEELIVPMHVAETARNTEQ